MATPDKRMFQIYISVDPSSFRLRHVRARLTTKSRRGRRRRQAVKIFRHNPCGFF